MNEYMKKAIELALENVEDGGDPYGALIVHEGVVIASGVNTTHKYHDVSGHAELIAIKKAQMLLERIDLSDCILYASAHPCAMCFSAAVFSGIQEIYYCNTLEEASAIGMGLSKDIYDYLLGDKNKLDLKLEHVKHSDGVMDPFAIWSTEKKQ